MPDVTDRSAEDRARAAERDRQAFTDLQNEVMGNVTGRQSRFLPSAGSAELRLKREREAHAFRTALAMLLDDPIYAQAYRDLGDALGHAETQADAALVEIGTALEALNQELADMETRAARGPDGSLVFRTEDGRAVYGNGRIVPAEIAEGILWPADTPTAEVYVALQARQKALDAHLSTWGRYRTDVLGRLRDRYDDVDAPMSLEDMQEALDEIEHARPPAFTAATPSDESARVHQATPPNSFPKL